MPSKQVTDHGKRVNAVTAAIDTHGGAVATELAAQLAPHLLPGEVAPDHGLTLKLISRRIAQTHAAYAAADEANLSGHSSVNTPRHDRDAAVHAPRRALFITTGLLCVREPDLASKVRIFIARNGTFDAKSAPSG